LAGLVTLVCAAIKICEEALYCIYTNEAVPRHDGNFDHVIPLSLGGDDQFCVWSQAKFNSTVGGSVDGAIANDSLMMFARRNADARGHSGKEPIPVFKRSEIEGRPAQVSFGSNAIEVWDAKSKSYLSEEDLTGKLIKSSFKIDRLSSIRFAAKVALGGGYFVYGDALRTAIDCDELRRLIQLNVETARYDDDLRNSRVVICDRFHSDLQTNPQAQMYRALAEFQCRSKLICVPHNQSISFHIGILGVYMGTVIIPADTRQLPNDTELHDLGHVLLLGPGSFRAISYRKLAAEFLESTEHGPKPSSLAT
jgi:hypothetical protein